MKKKTLVLGASENPERYSNMAIKKLKQHGHEVVAIGAKDGEADGVKIHKDHPDFKDLNTVTMYLSEKNQHQYYDYILKQKPERIIFNPGAENPELFELAQKNGITPQNACTLVLLSTNQY